MCGGRKGPVVFFPAKKLRNAPWEVVGGGDSHCVKKRASLCSASVCFFGVFLRFEKSKSPAQKKLFGGKTWAGAPSKRVLIRKRKRFLY